MQIPPIFDFFNTPSKRVGAHYQPKPNCPSTHSYYRVPFIQNQFLKLAREDPFLLVNQQWKPFVFQADQQPMNSLPWIWAELNHQCFIFVANWGIIKDMLAASHICTVHMNPVLSFCLYVTSLLLLLISGEGGMFLKLQYFTFWTLYQKYKSAFIY